MRILRCVPTTPRANANQWLVLLLAAVLLLPAFSASAQDDTDDDEPELTDRQSRQQGSRVVENNIRVPAVKVKVSAGNDKVDFSGGIDVQASQSIRNLYPVVFASLESTVADITTSNHPLTVTVHEAWNGDSPDFLPEPAATQFAANAEAYVLRIRDDGVGIWANSEKAVVHGLTSLEFRILRKTGDLKELLIVDWPDHSVRALHFPMKMLTVEVMKSAIDRARRGHYNTLILNLKNSVALQSIGDLAYPYAISTAEFQEVVEYARQSGLTVIPGLTLLSHQMKDFIRKGKRPELMYNDQTYDPRKQEVFELIYAVIDELDSLIQPTAIHIGHDEVVGHNQKQIDKYGPILPAHLYLQSVNTVHSYIKNKGIETWMWGDMLMIPSEFPEMHKGAFNGTPDYVAIRDSVPRDIVLCDWHYRHYQRNIDTDLQFPSINLFANMGFQTLGATWKEPKVTEKFSRYAHAQNHANIRGMIATTWSLILLGASEYERSDRWEAVDAVIQESAQSFWNAE